MRGRVSARRFQEFLPKMFFIAVFALLDLAQGKIYERCELARELKYVQKAPDHQLATWVCIAEHESRYNTSIVGHLSGDGSGDHGIFQISDQFWCSPPGKGLACGLTCAELEDDDISDDFECAQRIYREHKHLTGDGFNAWVVYKPHCKGPKADSYLKDCFDVSEPPKTFTTPVPVAAHGFFNTAAGRANKEAPISTQTTTSAPFLGFGSFSGLRSRELTTATPGVNSFFQNNRFFTPTEGPRVDFFTPTTTLKPIFSTRTTFTPTRASTGGSVVFNQPATIQSVTSTVIPTSTPIGQQSTTRTQPGNQGTIRIPSGNLGTTRIPPGNLGTTRSPAPFGFGRTFSTPSTSAAFSQTTSRSSAFSQSTTIAHPRPIFIINGVKWY